MRLSGWRYRPEVALLGGEWSRGGAYVLVRTRMARRRAADSGANGHIELGETAPWSWPLTGTWRREGPARRLPQGPGSATSSGWSGHDWSRWTVGPAGSLSPPLACGRRCQPGNPYPDGVRTTTFTQPPTGPLHT